MSRNSWGLREDEDNVPVTVTELVVIEIFSLKTGSLVLLNALSPHRGYWNILTKDRVTGLIKCTVTGIFNACQQASAQSWDGPATRADYRLGNVNGNDQSAHPHFTDTTTRCSLDPDFANLIQETARYIKITQEINLYQWQATQLPINSNPNKTTPILPITKVL